MAAAPMTSYVPLRATLSPRRRPCQDRATTWPRAKLSARSTSAHDAPTVPFWDAPRRRAQPGAGGHLCEKRDARGMSTRTSYPTPTATASSSPSNGDGPEPDRRVRAATTDRSNPPLPDGGLIQSDPASPTVARTFPKSVRQPKGTAPAHSVLLLWKPRYRLVGAPCVDKQHCRPSRPLIVRSERLTTLGGDGSFR
jgi:hypothetical protein